MLDPSKVEIVLGPPGTGKTFYLLNQVDALLAAGSAPEQIAYLAFTRRASLVAKERALQRFTIEAEQLRWFRTIHSLTFRGSGANRKQIVTPDHIAQVCQHVGLDYAASARYEGEDGMRYTSQGANVVFLENLARITGKSFDDVWAASPNLLRDMDVGIEQLADYGVAYATTKSANGLLDFTDLLIEFLRRGFGPELAALIVDEAQDLSRLQWAVVEKLAKKAERVIVAGDDQQAIFKWSGADVDYFLALEGKEKILEQSYRIPRAVHELALKIAKRIGRSRPRVFKPRDVRGSVEFTDYLDELDASHGEWLLLARHLFQVRHLEEYCRARGWFYELPDGEASNKTEAARAVIAWENLRRGAHLSSAEAAGALLAAGLIDDAEREQMKLRGGIFVNSRFTKEQFSKPWFDALSIPEREANYFRQAREDGDKMAVVEDGILVPAKPRIIVSTIHGAKGGQADNVFMTTDVSESTWNAMQEDESDEARVFYVGATRARERLIIQRPATPRAFEIPEN